MVERGQIRIKKEQWKLSDLVCLMVLCADMAYNVYVSFLTSLKSSGNIHRAGTSLQSLLFAFCTFVMTLDKLILAHTHCSLPGNRVREIFSTLSTLLVEKTYPRLCYYRCYHLQA